MLKGELYGYETAMNDRKDTTDVTDGEPPVDETDNGPQPVLRHDPSIEAGNGNPLDCEE